MGGGSFPELGGKVYGRPGKILVDIVLVASQFGFVCAYIYFIASQIGGDNGSVFQCATSTKGIESCADGKSIPQWWFLPICVLIFAPLVYVRKIEVFAATHVFGDIMIAVMLLALTVYAAIALGKEGPQFDDVKVFNS